MLHIKLKIEIENQIDIAAEDIPLEILYEDKDIIVINKKAGMVVHAGVGNKKKHNSKRTTASLQK